MSGAGCVTSVYPALQVALEDSLVTMSTILASRFVAGIRAEVEKVERQLSTFSDTLDQWVQVSISAALGNLLQCWCRPCASGFDCNSQRCMNKAKPLGPRCWR